MDLQKFADSFFEATCIISVQKKGDDGYGEIRIVAANDKYIVPLEMPLPGDISKAIGIPDILLHQRKYIPNSLYENYLPKDLNFEDICFRAAVKKLSVHTFFNLNDLNMWFEIFCVPVNYEKDDLCYCAYTAIPSNAYDVGMSSGKSSTTSEDVIKTCIKLNSTDDFEKTMQSIIHDIRLICRAEVCSIMLADIEKETFSVIATDRAEHTHIRPFAERADHSYIARTWADMITGRDCIIVKEERDWTHLKKLNPLWYEDLRKANVDSIVFLPLRYADETLGYIWATNFETADTIRIKETLELTTFFISSKLSSHKMLEHLKKISYTDRLTSIPNRFACTDVITHLIRTRSAFSVVSADINGFKSINDSMGFEAGNAVLKEIASRWVKIAKENMSGNKDLIARMGGDEFAFVIKGDYSEEQIMRIISQYEGALNKRVNIDGQDIFVTASFGYSTYPDDARTSDSLISDASAAMREVKRLNSSNHILHFTSDMLRPKRSLVIENKLRTALENDGIFFHLQPQFDMEHRLYGFEALARMKDENGNFISPGEFIPVAEKVGLVDKIDAVVFRKAAVFIGSIIKNTGKEIVLSVNVSVRHLMKKDFPEEVHNILLESGMPAKSLELEITESIMIESADKALKCIDELRKMGINIAIDDFGTGYSSLSYLNKFPANLLKIDKSFIDKMNDSDSSKQYVAAIISIGHIMGFKVISEGVEKDTQFQTLKDIGCDLIQGYIWGKPMPAEQAEKLITDSKAD